MKDSKKLLEKYDKMVKTFFKKNKKMKQCSIVVYDKAERSIKILNRLINKDQIRKIKNIKNFKILLSNFPHSDRTLIFFDKNMAVRMRWQSFTSNIFLDFVIFKNVKEFSVVYDRDAKQIILIKGDRI